MACEWGHDDCANEDDKCFLCITESLQYVARKQQKRYGMRNHAQKKDGRQGSGFEFKNHQNNEAILQASSGMTLNSGATVIEKGDEQIRGVIRVMEELKTKTGEKARGAKSFAVKKEWLDKLHTEAMAENMEFWYLKFSFFEFDPNVYVVVEQDIIMSMVKTMVEDRKRFYQADKRINLAEKKTAYMQAKNAELLSENELLKAQLSQYQTDDMLFDTSALDD